MKEPRTSWLGANARWRCLVTCGAESRSVDAMIKKCYIHRSLQTQTWRVYWVEAWIIQSHLRPCSSLPGTSYIRPWQNTDDAGTYSGTCIDRNNAAQWKTTKWHKNTNATKIKLVPVRALVFSSFVGTNSFSTDNCVHQIWASYGFCKVILRKSEEGLTDERTVFVKKVRGMFLCKIVSASWVEQQRSFQQQPSAQKWLVMARCFWNGQFSWLFCTPNHHPDVKNCCKFRAKTRMWRNPSPNLLEAWQKQNPSGVGFSWELDQQRCGAFS